jgi:hypothetical protein
MRSARRLGAAITAGLAALLALATSAAAQGTIPNTFPPLIANQLAPEEFVSGYVAEIERTLERAGYYKK